MDAIMTGREVEQHLGASHIEREKLHATGILVPTGKVGRTTIYARTAVERLAALPWIEPSPPSLIVRLTGPTPADDEEPQTRAWRGWSQDWDEQTQTDAARQWWPARDPEAYIGGTLIAVVGSVIVSQWTPTDWTTNEDARVSFAVDQPRIGIAGRIRLPRGPISVPFL